MLVLFGCFSGHVAGIPRTQLILGIPRLHPRQFDNVRRGGECSCVVAFGFSLSGLVDVGDAGLDRGFVDVRTALC